MASKDQPIAKLAQTGGRGGFEEYLLQSAAVDRTQLQRLSAQARSSRRPLPELLVEERLLSEEEVVKLQSNYFRLPYVDLRTHLVPKEILEMLPPLSIATYRFVPFAFDGQTLKVALTNPADLGALEALEFFVQKKRYSIEIYLTSLAGFQYAVSQSKDISTEVGSALEDIAQKEKEFQEKKLKEVTQARPTEKIISEAPISKIVDVILRHAIEQRASDIHIEPGEHDLRVRYRIDGVLQNSLIIPRTVHAAVVSRIKILSNMKIDEQRLPQDGRFHIQIDRSSVDFRVSTLPTVNGEKVVLRILDKSSGVPTIAQLGILGRKKSIVEENLKKPHGMFLVTGPTGSGKSTTLYAVLNSLNHVGVNIVTLEDPVEYYIEGINQSQVKPEIGMTFASGLRSILRQDPNIIMVGEIRDAETAELAVHSALTGHLVFSTLHTNDAVGALPRLIDMGIDPFLIVASLNLVMAQRLVRRLCEDCRRTFPLTAELKKELLAELKDIPTTEFLEVKLDDMRLYRSEGCAACGHTGYRGRIGIYEVLPATKSIQELILAKESGTKLLVQARKEDMITMKQDGYIKALKGITSLEEVYRVTKE